MNYRQLLNVLERLTDEELNQDITIYSISDDEFFPARALGIANKQDTDVLDEGHLYITFEG